MSEVTMTVPFQSARIPSGHSLVLTLVDEEISEQVVSRIVFAEARNSEMGETYGTKTFYEDDRPSEDGDWPIWAERYVENLIPRISETGRNAFA